MKLHTNHVDIERGGVQSESTFTIKTNALSFSILSSGLYTDPEMAIVRELSCNAYDAHVAGNNADTPFEIHLPNELEPFLSIKDFGIGLADADIQGECVPVMYEAENGEMIQELDNKGNPRVSRSGGLYTTYFDSTKTNSNDFIGALGLGSKSPFSYSTAFEVISRHGGMKRTYAIFLNEDGIPSVALMGTIPTDEHSGLEVKIAIKACDFHKFRQKTATALKYFPVKPIVKGALSFEFDKLPTHKIETSNWMLSASGRYDTSTLIAVQGNVAYRVDIAQFRDELSEELYKFVERSHIVAYFTIGDLEVSANREEIRYDKRSVETIVKRLKEMRRDFTKEVEAKIGNINKKYWYACIELNTLSQELFGREEAIRTYVDVDKVKDKNLKRYITDEGRVGYSPLLGHELSRYSLGGYYGVSKKLKRSSVGYKFEPEGGTIVVINDVPRGGLQRLKKHINENLYVDALVVSEMESPMSRIDNTTLLPIKFEGHTKEFKRLMCELGNPDIYKISEITEALVAGSTSRELTFYKYDGMHSTRGAYYDADKISWKQVNCDLDAGGLYIPLKYASTPCLVNTKGNLTPININLPAEMVAIINFLIAVYNEKKDTNHTIHTMVGMPTSAFNRAKKNDKWVNLFEYAKEILPEYIQEISLHKRCSNTSSVLGAKEAIKHQDFVAGIERLSDDSEFKQAMLPLIAATKTSAAKKSYSVATIERLFNKLCSDQAIDDSGFYGEDAFNKYPMLDMLEILGYSTKWSVLFDYINMIDRS